MSSSVESDLQLGSFINLDLYVNGDAGKKGTDIKDHHFVGAL